MGDKWFGSPALSRRTNTDDVTPSAMARIAMMMDRISVDGQTRNDDGQAPPAPKPPQRLPRHTRKERVREVARLIPLLSHQTSWDLKSASSDTESTRSRSPRSGGFPSVLSFQEPFHLVTCASSDSEASDSRNGSRSPPRSGDRLRKDMDDAEGGHLPFFACCIRR